MSSALNYKIISQNDVVIVSFTGQFSKETKGKIQQCHEELLSYTKGTVIFYFKDVISIDKAVHRELAILQQEMRSHHPKLFLTDLVPSLKSHLAQQGIIRLQEVKNTLKDALDLV